MKSRILKNKLVGTEPITKIGEKSNAAFFLAVAMAAVLGAGLLIYLKFSDFGSSKIEVDRVVERRDTRAVDAIQSKLPTARDSMLVPDKNSLKGRWVTQFAENSIAEITFGDSSFQIIYTRDPQGRARKYSRGQYSYDVENGTLNLVPIRTMGAPDPVSGVFYKILTMRPYTFKLLKQAGNNALHFVALEQDVLAKAVHPLFLFADYSGAPVLEFSPVQNSQ